MSSHTPPTHNTLPSPTSPLAVTNSQPSASPSPGLDLIPSGSPSASSSTLHGNGQPFVPSSDQEFLFKRAMKAHTSDNIEQRNKLIGLLVNGLNKKKTPQQQQQTQINQRQYSSPPQPPMLPRTTSTTAAAKQTAVLQRPTHFPQLDAAAEHAMGNSSAPVVQLFPGDSFHNNNNSLDVSIIGHPLVVEGRKLAERHNIDPRTWKEEKSCAATVPDAFARDAGNILLEYLAGYDHQQGQQPKNNSQSSLKGASFSASRSPQNRTYGSAMQNSLVSPMAVSLSAFSCFQESPSSNGPSPNAPGSMPRQLKRAQDVMLDDPPEDGPAESSTGINRGATTGAARPDNGVVANDNLLENVESDLDDDTNDRKGVSAVREQVTSPLVPPARTPKHQQKWSQPTPVVDNNARSAKASADIAPHPPPGSRPTNSPTPGVRRGDSSMFDVLKGLEEDNAIVQRIDQQSPSTHNLEASAVSSQQSSSPSVKRTAHQAQYKGKWCMNERYVFQSALGQGAQGSVWKALDLARSTSSYKHYVAIKIVKRCKYRRRKANVLQCGLLAGHPDDSIDGDVSNVGVGHLRRDSLNALVGNAARVTQTFRRQRQKEDDAEKRNGLPAVDDDDDNDNDNDGGRSRSSSQQNRSGSSGHQNGERYSDRLKVLMAAYQDGEATTLDGGADNEMSHTLVAETLVGLMRHETLLGLEEIIDDPATDYVFLVTRLLDGPPCSIARSGKTIEGALLPSVVAGYAFDIATALNELHSCGIVHCDVKPDNLLKDGKRLVLGDFGLSRLEGGVQVIGGGNGTFAFWSPELFEEKASNPKGLPHTPASDCYAFGVCLYIMLFGCFPYWTDKPKLPGAWKEVLPGCRNLRGVAVPKTMPRSASYDVERVRNDVREQDAFALVRDLIQGLLLTVPKQRLQSSAVAQAASRFSQKPSSAPHQHVHEPGDYI